MALAGMLLVVPASAWAAFAGDGYETTNFGGVDGANAIAVQKDRAIVLAGATSAPGTFDFAVARFTKDGAIDSTFSTDGRQTTAFGDSDSANGVAIQENGRIVTVGSANSDKIGVARYLQNGDPDNSFSKDGALTTRPPGGGSAQAVAIQKDGRIVVAGNARSGDDFALVRYKPNGKLDRSFAGDGKATINFGGQDGARALAIQRDGRIVVGGADCAAGGMCTQDNFAIARLRDNGKLDKSFSSDGKAIVNLAGGSLGDSIDDVAIQGDGRIVAVGQVYNGSDTDFGAVRFKPNGKLDRDFSGDGKRIEDLGGDESAHGVAIQGDDRIVLAGSTNAGPTLDTALVRYKPNGRPDDSFAGDGTAIQPVGSGAESTLDVAMQGSKYIVTGGSILSGNDFLVMRFNVADGSLAN
jgi:uncharacterized delta-60 repeat protein